MIKKALRLIADRVPATTRRVSAAVAKARSGLLTTAGLGSGVAAFWTAWGVAAGLGSLAVAFLLLEWTTRDDSGTEAKGAK